MMNFGEFYCNSYHYLGMYQIGLDYSEHIQDLRIENIENAVDGKQNAL